MSTPEVPTLSNVLSEPMRPLPSSEVFVSLIFLSRCTTRGVKLTLLSRCLDDHSNAAHNLLAMMRVGILEAGMEVEHLKKDFATSDINPDRHLYTTDGQQLPNAEERLQQTQLNSQGPRPKAPMGQPQATMADRFTLNVPPSERLKISHTVPPLRPGRESRAGQLQGTSSMMAEVNGEIDPLIGAN